MYHIGEAARLVREKHQVSQKHAAELLGVSSVHLCNVEKGRTSPSYGLIESYRRIWNIDLYVLAWCLWGDLDRLPRSIRSASKKLGEAWLADLNKQGMVK